MASAGLESRLRERIHRFGAIPFADFVAAALYDDEGGFFTTTGEPGRRGDFITSPEIGPLFGAVVARALDTWWEELGRPDPFFVIEGGAGTGALARSVVKARPACLAALRYVLVESSERLRSQHASSLPLEPPEWVLGPPVPGADPDEDLHVAGLGPAVVSLPDLPALDCTGVVLANELLDNLPFSLLERTRDGWAEVRVGEDDGRFVEVLVPAADPLVAVADRHAPAAQEGQRVPIQTAAAAWVRRALGHVRRGRLVVIDYAATTAELAARPAGEWLRTYRNHQRGDGPLVDPGSQDITCEVAFDQLPGEPVRCSQAEFLAAHGIDDLVAGAAETARETAAAGGLDHLAARSRINEAKAITDPAGLGAFTVLEWVLS